MAMNGGEGRLGRQQVGPLHPAANRQREDEQKHAAGGEPTVCPDKSGRGPWPVGETGHHVVDRAEQHHR